MEELYCIKRTKFVSSISAILLKLISIRKKWGDCPYPVAMLHQLNSISTRNYRSVQHEKCNNNQKKH